MNPHLERSIEGLRAHAFLGAFLGATLRLVACGAAGLAALVLVLRAGFGLEPQRAASVYAALGLAPIVAWFWARRQVPSHATAAAWLDVRAGGSGSIVALDESPDPRWEPAIVRELARQPSLPRIDVRRPAWQALGALACAAFAAFVPVPVAILGPPTLVQSALLESVEDQLAALEEVFDLEPEVAAELRDALARLREDGALTEPEAAFEALDRAQDRLQQEAYERAELLHSAADDLAEMTGAGDLAQERLERTLERLAAAGFSKDVQSALERELGAAGVTLPPGTKLDAGQIDALSRELAELLAARSGELARKGLLDAKSLAKLGELAKLDGFEPTGHVCDASCEQHECDSTCEQGGQCDRAGRCHRRAGGLAPGAGGVNRGRADAELSWGEETRGDVDSFAPRVLPDARYADPEHSAIVGLSAAAPTTEPSAEAPGAEAGAGAGGQSAWRRRLAPYHREAVKTWFGPGGG